MEWFISVGAVWLLGSAFGYGWSVGSLQERGSNVAGQLFTPVLWMVWPAYMLGKTCGQRYTARKLAPERMRDKLLQEQLPGMVPTSITGTTIPWPSTWGSTP